MIATDQPNCFPEGVTVRISSINDGSMKDGVELMTPQAVMSRAAFLRHNDMDPDNAAVLYADFSTDTFCHYETARPGLMPGVDAAMTRQTLQPLVLPLADCVGTVLYDPDHHAIMLAHLGRHSVEQCGGMRIVEAMQNAYTARPECLQVWLGPSPNQTDYPLHAFDNRSFNDVITEQLRTAGITEKNIVISPVDTSTNPAYFSHSQFLRGKQDTDGRYAIAVMLT